MNTPNKKQNTNNNAKPVLTYKVAAKSPRAHAQHVTQNQSPKTQKGTGNSDEAKSHTSNDQNNEISKGNKNKRKSLEQPQTRRLEQNEDPWNPNFQNSTTEEKESKISTSDVNNSEEDENSSPARAQQEQPKRRLVLTTSIHGNTTSLNFESPMVHPTAGNNNNNNRTPSPVLNAREHEVNTLELELQRNENYQKVAVLRAQIALAKAKTELANKQAQAWELALITNDATSKQDHQDLQTEIQTLSKHINLTNTQQQQMNVTEEKEKKNNIKSAQDLILKGIDKLAIRSPIKSATELQNINQTRNTTFTRIQ